MVLNCKFVSVESIKPSLIPHYIRLSLLSSPAYQAHTTSLREHRQPLQLLLTPLPHKHHDINNHSQQTSANLQQANIKARALHSAVAIKVNLINELLLNRPCSRTARPTPKIITLPMLVLLIAIHSRCDTPHNQIAEHDDPAEYRRDVGSRVRFADTKLVAEDRAKVQDNGYGCDAEVGVCWPDFGVFGPGGAGGCCAVGVGDGAICVLRVEKLDERHCEGCQDADGD